MRGNADFSARNATGFAWAGCDFRRDAGYDPDSLDFFSRAMVSDPVVMQRHDQLVRWLKSQVSTPGRTLWDDLYLWYGADAGAIHDTGSVFVPASDGLTVHSWLNRRMDDLHAVQTTGAMQPLLDESGGPNGLPAIAPDGVDDGLEIANPLRLRPPLSWCAFGTEMASAGGGNRYILGAGAGSIAAPSDLLIVSDFSLNRLFNFSGVAITNEFPVGNARSGNRLITHVYNGVSSAAFATGLPDSTGALAVSTSGIGLGLTLFRSSGGNQNKGWYTHFMLFRTALSKGQHTALEALLFGL